MRAGDCTPGALHASRGTSAHITFQVRHMDAAFLAPSRWSLLRSELAKQIALACNADVRAVVDVTGENATVSISQDGDVSAYVLGGATSLNQLASSLYGPPFQSRLLDAASAIYPGTSAQSMSLGAISVQPEHFVPVVPTTTGTSTSTTTTSTTSRAGMGTPKASIHNSAWWWWWSFVALLVLVSGLTCAALAVWVRRAADCGESKAGPQREEVAPQSFGPVLLGGHATMQSSEPQEPKVAASKPEGVEDPAKEPSEVLPTLRHVFSTPPQTDEDVGDLEHGWAVQIVEPHQSVVLTTPRTEGDCKLAACSAKCW